MTKKGVNVLLYANTGTDAAPTWTVVAGQRGATLTEENETIETTSKSSGGAKEYEYGFYGWKISLDGIYAGADTGFGAIQDALRNKTVLKAQIQDSNVTPAKLLTGDTLVTSIEQDAPHDGEYTYKIELQGTSTLTDA